MFYDKYDYQQPEVVKETITGEAHTVPATSPYEIFLRHIPHEATPSTVSISGFTEVAGTPGQGEFKVHYGPKGLGRIEFNAANASATVAVDYEAVGSVIWAETYDDGNRQGINHLQDAVNTHVTSTANPHSVTLERARQAGDTFAGDVKISDPGAGLIVTTPNGSKTFRIRVNDNGDLVTEEVV